MTFKPVAAPEGDSLFYRRYRASIGGLSEIHGRPCTNGPDTDDEATEDENSMNESYNEVATVVQKTVFQKMAELEEENRILRSQLEGVERDVREKLSTEFDALLEKERQFWT